LQILLRCARSCPLPGRRYAPAVGTAVALSTTKRRFPCITESAERS